MCGIAGFLALGIQRGIATEELPAALSAIRHRGPDAHGLWFDQEAGVGLGHVRLSILDVSDAAKQPMVSNDGRWVMVFNGEVYNFKRIRDELAALGVTVTSTGDSAVILEAFALWGLSAVEKMVGMFAIALWDRHTSSLFLLRDRVGVKPLFFTCTPGTTVFASELKALHKFSCFSPVIDRSAVGEYLRYGYLSEENCIYLETFKVQPGSWVQIKAGRVVQKVRYWSVTDSEKTDQARRMTDPEWVEHIEHLITDAASLRLVSDVPVGVFLSGGIDSSLVAACTQQLVQSPIKTFTIGFSVPELNEAEHAKRVASHLGTDHHEFIMPPERAMEILQDWGDLFDEPFGDSSGLPTLLVSRAAAEQVKVVISADGGDELFSGYGRYSLAQARWKTLQRIPAPLRKGVSRALYKLPMNRWDDYLADEGPSFGDRRHSLRFKTTWRALKIRDQFAVTSCEGLYDLAQTHMTGAAARELSDVPSYPRRSCSEYKGPSLERFAKWDFEHYLPGDIMTKVDRATMFASIEGREPLLDHRLIEAAYALPLHLKRGDLGPKHILKEILYKKVPRQLVDRPKKGFAVPMEQWLRGPLRPLLLETLTGSSLALGGILNPKGVSRLVGRFLSGDSSLTTPVWLLLAFELWRKRWHPQ